MTQSPKTSTPVEMSVAFSDRVNGRVLWILSKLAEKTCRITVSGWDFVDRCHQEGRSVLYGTWHGNSMMLVSFMRQLHPGFQVSAMIPDDWRGAALYYWLSRTGITPWPMDLENKGMNTARRFAEMIRLIKNGGFDSYVSPDGPSGPSHIVKPGLTFLAQKTGLPVVPLAGCCRHGYTLNRWDAYKVPFPFSRIHVAAGEPITVQKGDDLEAATETIRRALNDVTLRAQAEFYE